MKKKIDKSTENYKLLCTKVDKITEQSNTLTENMENIKNNLQLIVLTTQSTQKKIVEIEKEINDKITILDKKVTNMKNEYIDKSCLVVILFKAIHALTSKKMTKKMDIMMNLIDIFK